MVPRKLLASALGLLFTGGVVAAGFFWNSPNRLAHDKDRESPTETNVHQGPTFSSGWQPQVLFDRAYDRVGDVEATPVASILVAHHLLVADKIAETFLTASGMDGQTIVIVGPNHFSVGLSAAQTTVGTWETPYGSVQTDQAAVQTLLHASAVLQQETLAFENEHSVAALTPFIAKTFPHSKIVPVIVDERLSADDAWALGELIAQTLPHALLVASVDMVHGQDPAYTAEQDLKIIDLLENAGYCGTRFCTEDLPIDSNASLRVLSAFNAQRGAENWHLIHHGSSLEMGATTDPHENVSHILGYYAH